jgi:hypothetical protein
VGQSWEKNFRPGRLANEILCFGDQIKGNPHNRGVRGYITLLLRQSSDLQLCFLGHLIDGDIAVGTALLFVSNNVVTRTMYTYDCNLAIFTLDLAGKTNQLIFGLNKLVMRCQTRAHLVPPVVIMLQAEWDSGHSLGTDWTK